MGAASVTGVGQGACDKLTPKELAMTANGPKIYVCGIVTAAEGVTSPPTSSGRVIFPRSLPGSVTDFSVFLTPFGTTGAYIAALLDDDDGNMNGFTVVADDAGEIYYMVVSKGVRPEVNGAI